MRLALGMAPKFYSSVVKALKLKVEKCWGKIEGRLFALSPSPILNNVKHDLADFRPVKTIKKQKCRFYDLLACSVELTFIVPVIILGNTFGSIKINCVFLRGDRVGEIALWSLHVCRCSNSASVKIIKSSQSANRHQIIYFSFRIGEWICRH